ncbi:hypothetical protein ACCS79_03545 [Rhizobium johnstonii]|uniref:hypothetical protein n=1 Tax=Rhizobium johnstonii TaxID=3019933 RepID=UPI003F989BB6
MASQTRVIKDLVNRMISSRIAREPRIAHYDSRGRRDTAQTTGVIIGSLTPVDISYAVESTEIDYTPPS